MMQARNFLILRLPRLVITSGRRFARSSSCVASATPNRWSTLVETKARSSMTSRLSVNSNFDSGNIEIVDATDPTNIRLAIHADTFCEKDQRAHLQWFHYRVSGVRDVPLTMHLVNAGAASYAPAWNGYQACASYDLQHWFRVPTKYADGTLSISHTPTSSSVYYAYFAPYTLDQHMKLVQALSVKANVTVHVLGQSLDGHDLDCLQIGTPGAGKRTVWVIARQHPGESMAEYFMEGFLERLTNPHDAASRLLLQHAVVYAVPNINPDGSWRGHLRTNAAGANLNREWSEPSATESPEVLVTKNKMEETGVDLLLDIHGDEELPHVFIAGNEGIPGWSDRLQGLQDSFFEAFGRACPEFQTKHGYALNEPGKADLRLCSKQIGQRFDCLALTLEMPFKDSADLPEPLQGWSPERSRLMGAGMISAVRQIVPQLR